MSDDEKGNVPIEKCGCGYEGPAWVTFNGKDHSIGHSCMGYLIKRIEALEAASCVASHAKQKGDQNES